ncbi:MAG: hypothetical protein ACJAT0_002439, partial [Nonlabens sp.]
MIFLAEDPTIKVLPPIITDDTIVFGLLLICLALVFYSSSLKQGFWSKFYKVVPALLMCY